MKKFFRIVLILIIILLVLAGGYYFYQQFTDTKTRQAFAVVPEDAVFVVETDNLTRAWKDLSSNQMWHHLRKSAFFKEVDQEAATVDSYLGKNKAIDMLLSGRSMIISGHLVSGVEYDFLFVVDLGEAKRLKVFQNALNLIEGYQVKTRDFAGNEILEMEHLQTGEQLSVAILDNLALASFSGSILEQAIVQQDNAHWQENKHFQQVDQYLSSRAMFSLYFNFNMFDKFLGIYLDEQDDPLLGMVSQSLNFSAFGLEMDEQAIELNGFVGTDSVATYLTVLTQTPPGKMHAHEILSDQTALYVSMNFENYQQFHQALLAEFERSDANYYADYEKNMQRVEKLLKINVEQDVFSWIGQEIVLSKLRQTANDRLEDIVITLHANDIEKAQQGMQHIMDQIRKRSPVKFEADVYKNYPIHYLREKGLFKVFLSGLFEKMEKPYFTFIEDFVVFSNSKGALKQIINDFLNAQVLDRHEGFRSFKDRFEVQCNLAAYVQTPKLYPLLQDFATAETRSDLEKNKELIMSFSYLGVQLLNDRQIVKNRLIVAYDSTAVLKDQMEQLDQSARKELMTDFIEQQLYRPQPEDSAFTGAYQINYPDSSVHFEGELQGGQPVGLWRSFYPSGRIQSTVTYDKKGRATGEAFFYYDAPDEARQAVVPFQKGQPHGIYREYYLNGARKAEIQYEEGKKDGDALFFHETGALKIEGFYKDHEKHRRWQFYNENGDEVGHERWRRGEKKA